MWVRCVCMWIVSLFVTTKHRMYVRIGIPVCLSLPTSKRWGTFRVRNHKQYHDGFLLYNRPVGLIWKMVHTQVASGICRVWDDEIPGPKAMLDMIVSGAFPKSTGSSFCQIIFAQTQGTRMNVLRFVTKWNLPESKLNHPIQNSRGHQSVSVLYWIHEFEDLRSSKSRLFVASRTEWCQLRHAPATSP